MDRVNLWALAVNEENAPCVRQRQCYRRITDSHRVWPAAPNPLEQDFSAKGLDPEGDLIITRG